MNKNCSLRDIWKEHKNNDSPDFEKCIYDSIEITYLYTNHFDWEKYLDTYNDIKCDEKNELSAYQHWIEFGIPENRCAGKKFSQEPYERFEWESYQKMNPDLVEIVTELELYDHWIHFGVFENRKVTEVETFEVKTNTIETIKIKEIVYLFENQKINKKWVKTLNYFLQLLNWRQYLESYKDLLDNGINSYILAFIHWCSHGKDEGRLGKNFKKIFDIQLKNKIDEKTKSTMNIVNEKNMEEKTKQLVNMPIYIINLLERIDKKIDMQYQLNELKIKNSCFFKAYGKNDEEVKNSYTKYNEDFENNVIKTTFYKSNVKQKVINSIGAIGLIKSTIELFKKIENENHDYVMILEDDVCFHKSWNYMLKPIKQCLFHDLVYIGYNSYDIDVNKALVNDETTIIRTIPSDRTMGTFYGTYGYICNSKFRNTVIHHGISWFIKNNATLDYGYNILNWNQSITVAVMSGEPIVYPRVNDPESINQDRKDINDFYKIRQITQSNYLKPLKTNNKFVFIVPSYNNEKWIEYNIKSILYQTYTNWELIYINDCSNDKTEELFKKYTSNFTDKIRYFKNDKKYGQAFNRYVAYNMCEDSDYCILLDGDDWLNHKYVLQYLTTFITMYDVDITYGSFLQYEKNKISNVSWIPGDYDQDVIKKKAYRSDIWRAMHLRVIKAQHLKCVCPLDFIDDQYDFVITSTDMIESYASLEVCEGRHKKINEHLMVYNRENSMYYPTSYYNRKNKENVKKKEQIIKNVKNITRYKKKQIYDHVAIIDVEKDNYKDMIQFYKKDLVRKMDLFLVKGSIIQYYINKLNSYQNIIYLTNNDDETIDNLKCIEETAQQNHSETHLKTYEETTIDCKDINEINEIPQYLQDNNNQIPQYLQDNNNQIPQYLQDNNNQIPQYLQDQGEETIHSIENNNQCISDTKKEEISNLSKLSSSHSINDYFLIEIDENSDLDKNFF